MRPRHLLFLLFGFAALPAQAQIFADFKTKRNNQPFGIFTVQLDHLYSPFAVANFIRLAEGLVPWLDPEDGTVRTGPFYNGLAFDGMTANWEVSSGSPGNDRTGDAGSIFRDDFRSNNNPLNSPQFAIYMDNAGPNTNGSRFFINLTAALNPNRQSSSDRYTRFGVVIAQTNPPGGNGRGTVNAISLSAPGIDTIDTVTMRYVGLEAQNFRFAVEDDGHLYLGSVPAAEPAVFSFRKTGDSIILDWDDTPGSIVRLWASLNLQTWTTSFEAMNVPGGNRFGLDLTSSIELAPTGFFRGATIRYEDWPATERPRPSSTIQTNFFDPNVGAAFATTYRFDPSGTAGTYQSGFGNGTFQVTAREVLGPYRLRLELTPTSGNQPTYRFTLHYDMAWSSPIPSIALPVEATLSRLDGQNLANSGEPLQGGQWSYLPP